jgi:hypothetical protein
MKQYEVELMHEVEGVTPSTCTRKRRYKSSFRYSSMKDL